MYRCNQSGVQALSGTPSGKDNEKKRLSQLLRIRFPLHAVSPARPVGVSSSAAVISPLQLGYCTATRQMVLENTFVEHMPPRPCGSGGGSCRGGMRSRVVSGVVMHWTGVVSKLGRKLDPG